jgi:hypothetical protein
VEEKEPSRCAEEEEIQICAVDFAGGAGTRCMARLPGLSMPRSGLAVRPSREAGSQGEQRRARRHSDN